MTHYTGIHHAAFYTGDMESTIRFWRDLLGMRLVYGYGRAGQRQYFFELSPGTLLSFFEWAGVERAPCKRHGEPVRGPAGFDHVAIGVADEEALWGVADRLAGADQPVSDVVDHGFIRSVYAFDPNGIAIEFSCDVPGIDVRGAPVLRDPRAGVAAREGSEPRWDQWPRGEATPVAERVVVSGEGWEHFRKG